MTEVEVLRMTIKALEAQIAAMKQDADYAAREARCDKEAARKLLHENAEERGRMWREIRDKDNRIIDLEGQIEDMKEGVK